MADAQAPDFALAAFVLKMVIEEAPDRFVFQPDAPRGIALALDELFRRAHRFEPLREVEGLLKLGLLFEQKAAFEAADVLYQALAEDGRVLALLGLAAGGRARSARTRFQRMTGGPVQKAAPVYGAAAPSGSLKASAFMAPTDHRGRQIHRPT